MKITEFAIDFIWKRNRDSIQWNFAIECVVSLKTIANSLQILPYFFNNFFIFSQWPLIFDLTKFNTSLHRFLLKFLKVVRYSSIVFLVSCGSCPYCECNWHFRSDAETRGRLECA